MIRTILGLCAAFLCSLAVAADATGPLAFEMKTIDGKDVKLSDYQGKVVLIVNTASKCGNTPQYKQLEAIYNEYKEQGLVILGVPANNFGGQEPGTDEQIAAFCTEKYGVTFPMLAKVSVKGADKCPLYSYLTATDAGHTFGGDVKWNFEKFLVGRDGKLCNRFAPGIKPDADKVVEAIKAELAKN